ncbi:MAG: DNA repair protein RecO [Magnetovibrio sp.]|nr:DNA repair protein RecO [Magnetovibrio sp.]
MEWHDDGIVLAARKHGESSAIVTLLTAEHGRHLGLVRGGAGRRKRGLFQPGNRVRATWRARLAEHLGSYGCELLEAVSAEWLDDADRLAGLSAACAVADVALPERETHRPVYDGFQVLLDAIRTEAWPTVYVKWELGLLQELGFGLDFRCCAATGATEDLTHVSPKSGRAVSAAAAEPYRQSLLALPPFLLESGATGGPGEIAEALKLTGYFLDRHVFAQTKSGLAPAARQRWLERARRRSGARAGREPAA